MLIFEDGSALTCPNPDISSAARAIEEETKRAPFPGIRVLSRLASKTMCALQVCQTTIQSTPAATPTQRTCGQKVYPRTSSSAFSATPQPAQLTFTTTPTPSSFVNMLTKLTSQKFLLKPILDRSFKVALILYYAKDKQVA